VCRQRALKLSLQLARALHYLHAEAFAESGDALMHRDLKPQNLGLMGHGEEERLVLCDFGLAALIKTGSSSRAAHAPGYLAPRKPTGPTGSLRYMAPEVALGRMYDESCDVYSFAVVAWQMLSRLTPYFGLGGEAGHRERVVAGGERPALVETWPAPLKQLLARGWAADAGKRPKMAACVAELEKLCAAGP
jgi:serine/threonine protein kinase